MIDIIIKILGSIIIFIIPMGIIIDMFCSHKHYEKIFKVMFFVMISSIILIYLFGFK